MKFPSMAHLAQILALSAATLLSACSFNNVRPISSLAAPNFARSTVVYGVALEIPRHYSPQFQVTLDEYDIERQNISGNCFRFNRMQAAVASTPGMLKYFAFDVRPGHYIYSQFNVTRFTQTPPGTRAFVVPEGQIVYLGDFIYVGNKEVELRRNVKAMKLALDSFHKSAKENLRLAEMVEVTAPTMFLCTP